MYLLKEEGEGVAGIGVRSTGSILKAGLVEGGAD